MGVPGAVDPPDGVIPKPVPAAVIGAFVPKVIPEAVDAELKLKPPLFSAALLAPAPNEKIGAAEVVGAGAVVAADDTVEKVLFPNKPVELIAVVAGIFEAIEAAGVPKEKPPSFLSLAKVDNGTEDSVNNN